MKDTNKFEDYSNDALVKEIKAQRADPRYVYSVDLNVVIEITLPPPGDKQSRSLKSKRIPPDFAKALFENAADWFGAADGDEESARLTVRDYHLIQGSSSRMKLLLLEARRRPEIDVSQCQNCLTVFLDEELDGVTDMDQRVSPGEPVPSGECPDCHCLCQQLRPLRRQPTNTKR